MKKRYPGWFALIATVCLLAFSTWSVVGCEAPEGKEPVGGEPAKEQGATAEKSPAEPVANDAGGNDVGGNDAGGNDTAAPQDTTPSPDMDLNMKATDFTCILKWDKVNRYRITNKLGFKAQALAVARSKDGGTFPVGTVIQLVPQEAMVKRKKGWNPKTNDWEFFFLKVEKDKTTIVSRGAEDVKNQFGGNCLQCHQKAEAKWDMICGDDHGCDPLPLSPKLLENLQNSDPRCP